MVNPQRMAPSKMPLKNQQNAIYCNSDRGPTFGGGHDIYIYQLTQTQVVQVTVISATRISFPPDSRTHSSRELEILM